MLKNCFLLRSKVMREILFRAKTQGVDGWVYGVLFQKLYAEFFLIREFIDCGDDDIYIEDYIVREETIGQYTGCKDCNGVKIFEGDIIKSDRHFHKKYFFNDDGYGKVVWKNGGFRVENDGLSLSFEELNKDVFSVIGNIHDNPELLEKE